MGAVPGGHVRSEAGPGPICRPTFPSGNLTTERPLGPRFRPRSPSVPMAKVAFRSVRFFPRWRRIADDLCVIRSMHANTPNHEQSMRLMNCGDERLSRPSYGSWITYGLGTENQNLPGFIALCPGLPVSDVSTVPRFFRDLPGTYINTKQSRPTNQLENITNAGVSCARPRGVSWTGLPSSMRNTDASVGTIRNWRREPVLRAGLSDADGGYGRVRLRARARACPRDVRRQCPVPPVVDRPPADRARVRVVQCYHGDVQPWDSRDMIADAHRRLAGEVDQGSPPC